MPVIQSAGLSSKWDRSEFKGSPANQEQFCLSTPFGVSSMSVFMSSCASDQTLNTEYFIDQSKNISEKGIRYKVVWLPRIIKWYFDA